MKNQLSYEKNLIIYLKPENSFSTVKEELICKLCKGCVWKPVRCGNCGAYACQQCLDPFVNQFGACPSCAVPFEPRKIDKSVPENLKKLKFTCCECETQFKYKDALNHLKYCIKYLIGTVQQVMEENALTKQKILALTGENVHTCCLAEANDQKQMDLNAAIAKNMSIIKTQKCTDCTRRMVQQLKDTDMKQQL